MPNFTSPIDIKFRRWHLSSRQRGWVPMPPLLTMEVIFIIYAPLFVLEVYLLHKEAFTL